MPRTKKAAGQAVDRRNGRRAELQLGGEGLARFELPLRRPAWLAEVREVWDVAWSDPICQAWTAGDRPILLRWIDSVDRAARALRRADRRPVVPGSTGQLTEHPSYATAARAIATAEKCEAQLGFGALNREKLGFTIGAARKSLLELNEAFMGEAADDDADPEFD